MEIDGSFDSESDENSETEEMEEKVKFLEEDEWKRTTSAQRAQKAQIFQNWTFDL